MSFVETLADPAPESAVVDFLSAADGTRYRVAHFGAENATRGTVVIMNGRTEFVEKYFEVIGDLLARGYAVASLDWRGQGLSDRHHDNRHKGHVEHFDLFVSDLHQAIEEFVRPACPAPYRGIAHSMGGNIALRYLAAHPGTFESCVFSAPMWGLGANARPPWWMRGFSSVLNGLGLGHAYVLGGEGDYGETSVVFEGNTLTSDEERFRRFVAQVALEPRLELGSPTMRWLKAAIESLDVVHSEGFAEAIEIPIRVCTAGDDSLVSVEAQAQIAERLPNGKQIVVKGARHELLMERDEFRTQIFSAFDSL